MARRKEDASWSARDVFVRRERDARANLAGAVVVPPVPAELSGAVVVLPPAPLLSRNNDELTFTAEVGDRGRGAADWLRLRLWLVMPLDLLRRGVSRTGALVEEM